MRKKDDGRISRKALERIETFRIKPSKHSRLYFVVHVAKNVTAMRKTMRASVGECHESQLAGVMGVLPKRGEWTPIVGVIFLAKDWLGAGLVAHELSHAGFRACERLGIKVTHWVPNGYTFRTQPRTRAASPEERYANVVEYLHREFWRKAHAAGLIDT